MYYLFYFKNMQEVSYVRTYVIILSIFSMTSIVTLVGGLLIFMNMNNFMSFMNQNNFNDLFIGYTYIL